MINQAAIDNFISTTDTGLPIMKSWEDVTPAEKKVRLIARRQKDAEDQIILDGILAALKYKQDREREEKISRARHQLDTLIQGS